MKTEQPTWEEFNQLPIEYIKLVAPKTMIYSVSGTRRAASIANVNPDGEAYARWSRRQMVAALELLFAHGVKNILMPLLTPSQFNEVTENYSENLWNWVEWGLSGAESLADFDRHNWHVRLLFAHHLPRLTQIQKKLDLTLSPSPDAPNLWIYVVPKPNILYEWTLKDLSQDGNFCGVPQAIEFLYGEAIPPATLYLDFGKLIVSPDLLPPFLFGKLDCYWNQQPGYNLTPEDIRRILYDYAYLRVTWQKDKNGRAENALQNKVVWRQSKVMGLGRKVGSYWYPQD